MRVSRNLDLTLSDDEISRFITEDAQYGDITSIATIKPEVIVTGRLMAKAPGIIVGIDSAISIADYMRLEITTLKNDGDEVSGGETVLEVTGPAQWFLLAERLILNIMSHLSGIGSLANIVKNEVQAVSKKVIIAGTRKSLPGLRRLEKAALRLGGADTHRFNLSDCVMIKDNHISIVGDLAETVKLARKNVSYTKKIEVEVSNIEDARIACECGADILLIDNLSPNEIENLVNQLIEMGLRNNVILEASGGITRTNAGAYAKTGIDVISMGELTHSAKALDLSLKVTKVISK